MREAWATSAMNFVGRRAAEDPSGCLALLEALAALHQAHADEPALRVEWAKGVMNFVYDRAAEDPAECRALLNDVEALHLSRIRWIDQRMAF